MKRKLFLFALLVLLPVLAAAQSSVFVDNPDPKDRLNLRAKASADAASLGKYYSGTEAELLGYTKNGFAHVRIEPLEGYMDADYLSSSAVVSAQPWLTVRNSGGSGVNIRKEPSTGAKILAFAKNGERVTVLAVRRDGFLHVRFGDVYGFASAKLLSPAPDFYKTDVRGIIPTVPPTPSPFLIGWRMRAAYSSGPMPRPVSDTVKRTRSPSCAALTRIRPPPRLDLMPWYSAFSTSGWSSSFTM